MNFRTENDFEDALTKLLFDKGWDEKVLKYKTEEELIQNWANILYENNRCQDRLNDCPLIESEMQQILEQIKLLRTPLKLNGFINGKSVSIKRENPDDKLHFGKEVTLSIYDRHEVAAGRSRYQIARQPQFHAKNTMLNNRRGDMMLLINGMPLIHIELKKNNEDLHKAYCQIEKYSYEGVFSGLFSLVQIFVAMTPNDMRYFANPGVGGKFNRDYYFYWGDFNNEPIRNWKDIASSFLSIPMAHQLIGFYTVADNTDGILKVLRSYQYHAVIKIAQKVAETCWADENQYGGYIWHTTGSGKTMTSFKAAQLIAGARDADKVVFLVDRIELGTQSLIEYRNFAEEAETVQATENTNMLISKLKSNSHLDTLIVTSIQKMSNIKEDGVMIDKDISLINSKRIVFIIDECHRSTFGDMLSTIKETFPKAIFFGFTGTPIDYENKKNNNTTSSVFGDELHRYSIADGIRDKNVLGFDPYRVSTYREKDLRDKVGLKEANAKDIQEIMKDKKKQDVYLKYQRDVPMAGYYNTSGSYIKGIEDFINSSQYKLEDHREVVVDNILEDWDVLSVNKKFHAIFATSSILEAIEYYKLFKNRNCGLKIACLFDQNIDNNENDIIKEDAVIEMLEDYNLTFGSKYTIPKYHKYKKDVAQRLAHKQPYLGIDKNPEMVIDLLIVVDQMLTGYDSKWINTLYIDKLMKSENIIQAFSRTNRLFGPDKPFGTIKYYRKPFTMEKNINSAIKQYSGNKPLGLFVDHLEDNLNNINNTYHEIKNVYIVAGIKNFQKLPDEIPSLAKFAYLFKDLNACLNAARLQGFTWKKLEYEFTHAEIDEKRVIKMVLNRRIYDVLLQRYKELDSNHIGIDNDVPFEIETYITEIKTGTINTDYMNAMFEKYIKQLKDPTSIDIINQTLDELHKTFSTLTQDEQKYANLFLADYNSGDVDFVEGKTIREYITEYQINAKSDQIHKFSVAIGVDEEKLRDFMGLFANKKNINDFGRFEALISTVDKNIAKLFLEKYTGSSISDFMLSMKIDELLRRFILSGGFDV